MNNSHVHPIFADILNTVANPAAAKKTKTIIKEITLPYHSKNDLGTRFYRINEDESIVHAYVNDGYASVAVVDKRNQSIYLSDALEYIPCPASEVEQAIKKALVIMDGILQTAYGSIAE